jgi:ribonuclease P protein component
LGTPGVEPAGEGFPKSLRLQKRREFLRVQERGQKVAAGPLLGLALPNERGVTRLGLTVTTKVGNAVVRNRIRRRLREIFRKRRGQLPVGIDLVLIARASAAEAGFEELAASFESIAQRLRGMFP